MEAVETIELVRGGASLQFGPQFGGMLNYVLKRETEKDLLLKLKIQLAAMG
jgi:Fe(3+) dicitrate transport protein